MRRLTALAGATVLLLCAGSAASAQSQVQTVQIMAADAGQSVTLVVVPRGAAQSDGVQITAPQMTRDGEGVRMQTPAQIRFAPEAVFELHVSRVSAGGPLLLDLSGSSHQIVGDEFSFRRAEAAGAVTLASAGEVAVRPKPAAPAPLAPGPRQ